MSVADANHVIVSAGSTGSVEVQHRDFPEIRAEGANAAEAAAHLANQLTRALDTALTDWRRQSIQKAVEDVRSFADSSK